MMSQVSLLQQAFAVAFFIAVAVLIVLIKTPLSGLVLDQPNHRSLHQKSIPRTGGLAILVGVFLSTLFYGQANAFVFLVLALLAISFVDDIFDIPAIFRLISQVAVATIFSLQFVQAGIQAAILVFALVWMTNLYNFMDGSDGLAGGMAVIGFGVYGVAAYMADDYAVTLLCGSVSSASFAFLLFNFNPAKIFMGDSGSIPLGFMAGAIGIYGWQHEMWPWWFPMLVFSPFIVDATVTLLKRLLQGEKFWQPHRSHFYQKLVQMGFGHRKTALWEYALMSACAISALALKSQPNQTVSLALTAWLVIYFLLICQINKKWSQV